MRTITLAVVAAALAACAGPSRARYEQLLHECRDANREHLRLIQEYDARPMFDVRSCAKMAGGAGWVCPTGAEVVRPEQKLGAAEFGVGGY